MTPDDEPAWCDNPSKEEEWEQYEEEMKRLDDRDEMLTADSKPQSCPIRPPRKKD